MSLLSKIQESLVQDTNLALAMLQLRLLATRLGSDLLEEWTRHEVNGYPEDVPVPDYRKLRVVYKGTFMAPGYKAENAPIPPSLIAKLAGEQWVNYEMRQGVAAIDETVRSNRDEGKPMGIDTAEIIPLLHNKVYAGYSCYSLTGTFASTEVAELQFSIRSRALELTIELERIPGATDISAESQQTDLSENIGADVDQMVDEENLRWKYWSSLTKKVLIKGSLCAPASGPILAHSLAERRGAQGNLCPILV